MGATFATLFGLICSSTRATITGVGKTLLSKVILLCHIASQPWKFAIPFEAHQLLRSLNASASELACTLSSWATFGGMAEVFSMLEIM